MGVSLNNLAITATNSAMTSTLGAMMNTLQSRIANGGRDRNCKFYYNNGAGGSILQVFTKHVVGGVVSELKDNLENSFNSLFDKKKEENKAEKKWIESTQKKQEAELKQYGKIKVSGGVVYALDDWGCISTDALMLGIKLDKEITIKQNFIGHANSDWIKNQVRDSENNGPTSNEIQSDHLVWYDTTAMITINSDKNLVTTRVQGRDYSRKELVSNGDIKFSVSGQITSGRPDVYPTEEIKKFIKVMQYKGIVKINNQILDQFGIENIVITDFNISPRQGYKSVQTYSFSAIGLQPQNEIVIKEDTIEVMPQRSESKKEEDNRSEWAKLFDNELKRLESMSKDIFSQGLGLASGMLNEAL